MTRFASQKLLLIRADDATAFTGADAIVAKAVEIEPVVGDRASRELEQAHFGSQEEFILNQHQSMKFGIELAVDGDAGDAPVWATILKSCGFSETTVASTSVTYAPVTTGVVACKVGFQQSGKLHTLAGVKGSMALELTANAIPMLTFSVMGKWALPVEVGAPLVGDFSDAPHPQFVTKANTPTWSIFGQTDLAVSSLKVDTNMTAIHRSPANVNPDVQLTNRAASGELVVDANAWDVFSKSVDNTAAGRGAIQVVHGKTGGRQITLNIPRARLGDPKYGDGDGITQYTVPIQVLPGAAGNDELTIAIT